MSQPTIILYDVPSGSLQPWAPHVWRIRLILNYKRLPYRTYWVEFPEIENTLRAINAPPTSTRSDGQPVFTLPAILDPTHISGGTYIGPSGATSQPQPVVLTNANIIAEYLEQTYPARPVIPEGTRALQMLFVHYVAEIFVRPLLEIMIPMSHRILPPHVQRHFRVGVTREHENRDERGQGHGHRDAEAGVSRATAAQQVRRREELWSAVRVQFTFLAGILEKNASDGDGVVVMGNELTYADFAICSILIWIEKIAPHDGWTRVREWDGGRWRRLWERCRDYMDEF